MQTRRARLLVPDNLNTPAATMLFSVACWCLMAEGAPQEGIAGTVPPGNTEVCALRAQLPPSTARADGAAPRTWAKLFYERRDYSSPKIDESFDPYWGKDGCFTFSTIAPSDGEDPELRLEIWDDRSAVYDPAGVLESDVLLATATLPAGSSTYKLVDAKSDDHDGIQVEVSITVARGEEGGASASASQGDSNFSSLTTTSAFFIYTGAALFALLVCTCCFYGTGKSRTPKEGFSTRREGAPATAATWHPGPERSSSSRGSRPNLTIEVVTPPAARELTVVAVGKSASVQSRG